MPSIPPDQAETPFVLALDLGTSSFRAAVYDREVRAIEGTECQLGYEIETTIDGGAQVDANLLFDLTVRVVDGALARTGPLAQSIAAIGTTSFWHSLLGLDAHGDPVTPVLIWADSRSRAQVDELKATLDEGEIHARTGVFLHSSYWPAKLRWIAKERPAWWADVHHWVSFTDYLFLRLCGDGRTSLSMASGTGMLAVQRREWDPRMIEVTGIAPESLPELTDRDRPLHPLLPEWARRWPALADVPWFPAIGDGAAANLGSFTARSGRIALTIGTSGAMRMIVRADDVQPVPGLWTYRLDADHYVLGGALSNGGNVLQWLTGRLGVTFDSETVRRAGELPPDQHGLTVLPFLAGERSPSWNDHARGGIVGLSLATTSADLLRASMEGIAYRFALINQALLPLTGDDAPMVVANGGALLRSPAWLQITADVLGEPVVALPTDEEAAAAGAAIVALVGIGVYPDVESAPDWVTPEHTTRYEPDPARHRIYEAGTQRQADLERLLYPGAGKPDNRQSSAR